MVLNSNHPADNVVLVVEDESLVRILAAHALEDAGFTVLQAENADQAIETLEGQAVCIRVLFTDVHMPGKMNGVHLAHRARFNWPWIHLIIASGQLMPEIDELPIGSKFLPKPYEMRHVVKLILEATSGTEFSHAQSISSVGTH